VIQTANNNKLEHEKEKLNKLLDEALNRGTPIILDKEVIDQNIKVDELVVKIQKEKVNHRP